MKKNFKVLVLFFALVLGNTSAFGTYRAAVNANSSPSIGGYVLVSKSSGISSSSCTSASSSDSQGKSGFSTSGNFTFYFCNKPSSGYTFKGWNTDENANTGEGASSNPYSKSLKGTVSISTSSGGTTYTYYAIFARMILDGAATRSLTCDADGSTTENIVIKHVHAGTVSASVSGTGYSITSATTASSTSTEVTTTFTVKFAPTDGGSFPGKLTITSNNGLSTIEITLNGTANRISEYINWIEPVLTDYQINSNTDLRNLVKLYNDPSFTSEATDRELTFTSSNESVLAIDGYTMRAINEGSAYITASHESTKYQLTSSTYSEPFVVSAKKKPIFYIDDDDINLNRSLQVGETAIASFQNTQTMGNGLTYTITNENVISFDPSTNTITALREGESDITFHQGVTANYFEGESTFHFSVSLVPNTMSLAVASPLAMFVNDVNSALFANVNSDAAIQATIADPSILSFDAATRTLRALHEGTTTVVFSQPATIKYAAKELAALTVNVSKRANTLTVSPLTQTIYCGQTIDLVLSANNTTTPIVVTQTSGEDYASYDAETHRITASYKTGTATFVVSQAASDEYLAPESRTITITVAKAPNHVPFTYSQAMYNDGSVTTKKNGSTSFNSNGVQLGGGGGGFNYDDKYVIVHFEGVPDQLSFDYATTNALTTDCSWYIEESSDASFSSPTRSFTSSDAATSSKHHAYSLMKSTRYLKFCYSGNFGGKYMNIAISELSYLEAATPATTSAEPYDFGAKALNAANTETKSFTVNWCNIAPVTVTNSNPSMFSVSVNHFANYEQYGTASIDVTYRRDVEIGDHESVITISNGLQTQHIYVKGSTTKLAQQIEWHPTLVSSSYCLNAGEEYPSADIDYVARVANEGEIVFTSSNSEVIQVVDGSTLRALQKGDADITASYAGSAIDAEASDTKTFHVTSATRQSITWNDNLLSLKLGDAPLTLTATATSGGAIDYTLVSGEGVVSLSDGVLTILAAGEAYISATQTGGTINEEEYIAVSVTKHIIVRDPAAQCTDFALAGESCEFASNSMSPVVFELVGQPAATLRFKAHHDAHDFVNWTQPYTPLIIEQYAFVDNTWDWYQVFNQIVSRDNDADYSCTLSSTATKIRLKTNEIAKHYVSNLEVARRKYVEPSATSLTENVDVNTLYQKTIKVGYSNVDVLSISVDGDFTDANLSLTNLGDGCGHFGEESLVFSFTPTIKGQTYTGTITITDGKAEPTTVTIPVSLTATAVSQTITGFSTEEQNCLTTDHIMFSGSVQAGNPVYYTSSDESIATVEGNALVIKKSGTVVISAHCDAVDKFDAAPVLARTININKVVPTIMTLPTASDVRLPLTVSASTLDGGEATVDGSFSWTNAEQSLVAGENTCSVTFTPTNEDYYTSTTADVLVTALKREQTISWLLADDFTFNCAEKLQLSATTIDVLTEEETGLMASFEIIDGNSIIYFEDNTLRSNSTGVGTITIRATQSGSDLYLPAEPVERTINLVKADPVVTEAPSAISVVKGQRVGDSNLLNGTAMLDEVVISGIFEWAKPDSVTQEKGDHYYTALFVPANSLIYNTVECQVLLHVSEFDYTYTGAISSEWNNENNWTNGAYPSTDRVDASNGSILIASDIVISGPVTIGEHLSIAESASLIVENGGDIVMLNGSLPAPTGHYGDLVVKTGGKISFEQDFQVGNVYLSASVGNKDVSANSSQIVNHENLIINGNAFFDVTLDPSGECTPGWYDLTVPFAVDAMKGVYRFEGGDEPVKVANEKQYAIMTYHEDLRAQGEYGWKKFRGIMEPGVCYSITIDNVYPTYRFVKKAGAPIAGNPSLAFSYTVDGEGGAENAGWNCLGNGTLTHANLSALGIDKVQIYDHAMDAYLPVSLDETTFAVGAAFFVQIPETTSEMLLNPVSSSLSRAPQQRWSDEYMLALYKDGAATASDQLYLSASEDALPSYEQGHDLAKFAISTTSPQLWCTAYGSRLCDVELPLVNHEAAFPLTIFAPKAGDYTLSLQRMVDDGSQLYLTCDGRVIWNLAMADYSLSLGKGNTTSYGLLLVKYASNVVTGIDNAERSEMAEKLLINGQLYILRDGHMFDAWGQLVY